jgi:hypothetical protein
MTVLDVVGTVVAGGVVFDGSPSWVATVAPETTPDVTARAATSAVTMLNRLIDSPQIGSWKQTYAATRRVSSPYGLARRGRAPSAPVSRRHAGCGLEARACGPSRMTRPS